MTVRGFAPLTGIRMDPGYFHFDERSEFDASLVADVLRGRRFGVIFRDVIPVATQKELCARFWASPALKRRTGEPSYYVGAYHWNKPIGTYLAETAEVADDVMDVLDVADSPWYLFRDELASELAGLGATLRLAEMDGAQACPRRYARSRRTTRSPTQPASMHRATRRRTARRVRARRGEAPTDVRRNRRPPWRRRARNLRSPRIGGEQSRHTGARATRRIPRPRQPARRHAGSPPRRRRSAAAARTPACRYAPHARAASTIDGGSAASPGEPACSGAVDERSQATNSPSCGFLVSVDRVIATPNSRRMRTAH